MKKIILILIACIASVIILVLTDGTETDPAPTTDSVQSSSAADTHDITPDSVVTETAVPKRDDSYDTVIDTEAEIVYGEQYYTVDDVAYYLYTYAELPPNYITKKEAEALGWVSSEGNLWEVAPGAVIGGDRFGNYEGLLPKGASYTEADVNYEGGYRTGERLVFDSDGNIYYTADHYASFTQMYP